MPTAQTNVSGITILLAERDVIVRLALAEYLRDCGYRVIEASGATEAKTVLQKGPEVHILFADARLAEKDSGFALAQWARRYRSNVQIVLTGGLENKSEAASRLCSTAHEAPPSASHLRGKVQTMRTRQGRKRRGEATGPARASG